MSTAETPTPSSVPSSPRQETANPSSNRSNTSITSEMEEISSAQIGISADDETGHAQEETETTRIFQQSRGLPADFNQDLRGSAYSAYNYIDDIDGDDDDDDDDDIDDSEAEREWNENIEQLQKLFYFVLIPFAGKYLGRTCAYWGWNKFMQWKYPVEFHVTPKYSRATGVVEAASPL
ncbi:hypothetical protein KEM56_002542 [Ascosphaera pollenicola]|nr:hypothetical protein KEM56_002542 [Ascosphaera pollenicola]